MKVLIVSDYGNVWGGAERQIDMLLRGLRERGHDARLLATTAMPGGGPSLADFECFGTLSPFRTLLQSYNPLAARTLRRAMDSFRPDVVHVFLFLTQLSPSILPVLRSTPALFYVVWYRPICPVGTKLLPDGSPCRVPWGSSCLRNGCVPLRDWLPLMLQKKLWWGDRDVFDVVVANSDAVRSRLSDAGLESHAVVRPGVSARPLSRPLAPEPTVVFAGRLVREKGADVLVRAFSTAVRRVPGARLVLAGDGPERTALAELVRNLGLEGRIDLPGHRPFEETERLFEGAWVQAVPSRWPEPFGMVAAEAMMRGTAVVASDVGGLREVVRDGQTGVLVTPGDAEALAEALTPLLSAPSRADIMGRNGHEVAARSFGIAAHVDRFVELYRLARRSHRGGS